MNVKIGLTEKFNLLLLSDLTLQRKLEIEATEQKTKELLEKIKKGEIREEELSDEDRDLIDPTKLLSDFLFKNQFEKLGPNVFQHHKTGNYLNIYRHVEKEWVLLKKKTDSGYPGVKRLHQEVVIFEGYQITIWSPINYKWTKTTYLKNQNLNELMELIEKEIIPINIKQDKVTVPFPEVNKSYTVNEWAELFK